MSEENFKKYPLLAGDKFLQETHQRHRFGLPQVAWGNLANLNTGALAELGYYGAHQERYERYPHYSSPASGMRPEEKQKYYRHISEEKRSIQRKALQDYIRRHPGSDLGKFLALERKIEAEHANVRKSRRKEKRAAKQRAKTAKRRSSSSTRKSRSRI
jgi:hypothetical protein